MSQPAQPDRNWPTLMGKGGRMLSPRSRPAKEGEEDSNSNESSPRSPRGESNSPRSPRTLAGASLIASAPNTSSSSSSSSSSSKPKPDLRARALMSHKKMQEQFTVKKPACGQLPGGFSAMGSRVTPEEVAGRAVAFALEYIEQVHGRRPTLAEARVIAEMLRTLQSQQKKQAKQEAAAALAVGVDCPEPASDHSPLSPRRKAKATKEGGTAAPKKQGDGTEDTDAEPKKAKKKKAKSDKEKDKAEKRKVTEEPTSDKQDHEKDGKKDDKDDKKKKKKKKSKGKEDDKLKDKKEKSKKDKKKPKDEKTGDAKGNNTSTSSSSSGSSISGISGIAGFGVELLGGRLEYAEETKGENESLLALVSADTMKLRDIVYAYLKQSLPNEDQSPRARAKDDRFPWHYVLQNKSDKGGRDANEDTCIVIEHFNEIFKLKRKSPQIYIGLFDGHSGKEAADYCRHQLHNAVAQELYSTEGGDEGPLTNAFLRTDKSFNNKAAFMGVNDGSTAMVALLQDDRLIIANCGDSRGMLCRRTPSGETELISLCSTQSPNREDEKERVKKAGGTVVWYGAWRVNAVLGVSRSIGDRLLKHIIIPQPEIQITQLTPYDEFMVLGTDGLWDFMKEEEVVAFVRTALETKPKEQVCEALIEHVVSEKNGKDNVTVIVVFFDHASTSGRQNTN